MIKTTLCVDVPSRVFPRLMGDDWEIRILAKGATYPVTIDQNTLQFLPQYSMKSVIATFISSDASNTHTRGEIVECWVSQINGTNVEVIDTSFRSARLVISVFFNIPVFLIIGGICFCCSTSTLYIQVVSCYKYLGIVPDEISYAKVSQDNALDNVDW
jgi:hypothetical protein